MGYTRMFTSRGTSVELSDHITREVQLQYAHQSSRMAYYKGSTTPMGKSIKLSEYIIKEVQLQGANQSETTSQVQSPIEWY